MAEIVRLISGPVKYIIAIFSSLGLRGGAVRDCALCLAPASELLCGECACRLPAAEAACSRCGVPLPREGLCAACRNHPPRFDAAIACFEYRFPVDRLIQRFKYAGDLALGRWLGGELAHRVRHEARPDRLVVPPVARATLRERGFNQALEIAKVVASTLGLRLDRGAVSRRRDTAHQARLGRRERRSNLRGAFACDRSLQGQRVAIVDDVMTTGATAEAIAAILKSAGASHVSVWVVARAPEPED